ncbi:MAG TPA: septum formation family protein [Acidimicrobiia bacterium]
MSREAGSQWAPVVLGLVLTLAACSGSSEPSAPGFTLPTGPGSTTSPDSTNADRPPPSTVTPDQGYLWQAGDCVELGRDASAQLPYAPYGRNLIVDCSAEHSHEIYFTSTLDGEDGAPYPPNLLTTLWDRCYSEFASLMGFRSSDSTLEPILYLPDEQEWDTGERYHACVLFQTAPGNEYVPLLGSVADDPENYRWELEEGSCLDGGFTEIRVLEAVPCEQDHSFEFIGAAVHPAGAGEPFPGEDELAQFVQTECGRLLDEYAALPVDPELVGAAPHPIVFASSEWELGHRASRCFAFAATAEEGLLNVRGSLTEEDWEVLGPRDQEEGITA